MQGVSGRYQEVFDIELEGWCHGIAKYPGEISSVLVFSVVKELAPSFVSALVAGVVFDVMELATKLSRAAKYLVDEQDITFRILAQFPHPGTLSEGAQYTMAQVLERVEGSYPGTMGQLEAKWAATASS